ncbi:MAG TPA: PDR/VanB family oxidoreductase [Steroidobacteraceae bacterium]|nr:PDR/VanB family oxidoreductase [Steroidobacteraceae bacterium]
MQSLMAVRLVSKVEAALDIVVLELAALDGGALPPFTAGAHIDVEVAPGTLRQYSLCNTPADSARYRIGVLKDPASRGGSLAVHKLQAGDTIRISPPRNHFPLDPGAQRSLLFAGGIGVTPILCMAQQLSELGADFTMHYCARSRQRAAFADYLASCRFADRVQLHLDDGAEAQKLDIDAALGAAQAGTHIYVCGPGPFIQWVLGAAQAKGFPPGNLHREYFAPTAPVAHDADGPFRVKLASSGRIIDVPADRSIVAVLAGIGIDIPTSCEYGVCGTCITRVLEGEADHRDLVLTDAEKNEGRQFTPCCSRAKTPLLVIDL